MIRGNVKFLVRDSDIIDLNLLLKIISFLEIEFKFISSMFEFKIKIPFSSFEVIIKFEIMPTDSNLLVSHLIPSPIVIVFLSYFSKLLFH